MSAEMVRETIAFRATEEPRLIKAMMMPKPRETHRALRGMFQPGLTLRRYLENGNPSSLEKAQTCRDAVATSLTTARTRVMMMIAAMTEVPALLFVTSINSCKNGKPVSLSIRPGMSVIVKQRVNIQR